MAEAIHAEEAPGLAWANVPTRGKSLREFSTLRTGWKVGLRRERA